MSFQPSMRPPNQPATRALPARQRIIAAALGMVLLLSLAPQRVQAADEPAAKDPSPTPAPTSEKASGKPGATPATESSKAPAESPAASATDDARPATSTSNSTSTSAAAASDRDRAARRASRRDSGSGSGGPPSPDRRSSDRTSRRSDRGSDRGSGSTGSSGTNAVGTTGTEFSSFKLISDRNIFNPNRGRASSRADREPQRKPVQVDLVTLVGTLSYSKGDFAFFDGSSSQYRKTLKSGDSIAGYSIQSITNNRIQIEAEGKTLEMQVGSQLRREDEGEWKFIARAEGSSSSSSSSSSGSSSAGGSSGSTAGKGSSSSSSSGGDAAANDVLQRLMRKREQEK